MDNKTNIILIFIGIFLLVGCTKEGGNLYVEGRVYNPVTGEGIEGVTFHMYRNKTLTGYPPDSKVVAEATSDMDGYYKMSHTGGGLVYYVNINSGTGGYYLLGWANDNIGLEGKYRFQIPKGKNVTADYEMVPYGEYQLHVKNLNCHNMNDNIKIYYEGADIEDEGFRVGDVIMNLDGCIDIPGGDIWISHPMGNRYYRWEVTKNGVTNIYFDTIYIAPGEQRVYEVFY